MIKAKNRKVVARKLREEQLIIHREVAHRKQKPLYYALSTTRLLHSWLIQIIQIFKIQSELTQFLTIIKNS